MRRFWWSMALLLRKNSMWNLNLSKKKSTTITSTVSQKGNSTSKRASPSNRWSTKKSTCLNFPLLPLTPSCTSTCKTCSHPTKPALNTWVKYSASLPLMISWKLTARLCLVLCWKVSPWCSSPGMSILLIKLSIRFIFYSMHSDVNRLLSISGTWFIMPLSLPSHSLFMKIRINMLLLRSWRLGGMSTGWIILSRLSMGLCWGFWRMPTHKNFLTFSSASCVSSSENQTLLEK